MNPKIPDVLPGPSSNKKSKIEVIENENRQLKEAQNCKICMDNKVEVVFFPCRHLISCVSCAQQLRDCPNCRKFIQRKIKTFSYILYTFFRFIKLGLFHYSLFI